MFNMNILFNINSVNAISFININQYSLLINTNFNISIAITSLLWSLLTVSLFGVWETASTFSALIDHVYPCVSESQLLDGDT